MKDYEFYRKYANIPLGERFKIANLTELGVMSLHDIYLEVHAIDDKIRNDVIRKEKLIRIFEEAITTKGNKQ